MKIIHVIASIDPKFGGLQAVLMRIAAAQCLLDAEVHVVSYGDAVATAKAMEIGSAIPGFGQIHWHIHADPGRLERLFNHAALRTLRDLLPGTAFVHLHGLWEPLLLHAARLSKSRKVPYCICPAGMLDIWSLQQKGWKKRIALRLCYQRMLNGATFLHLLNQDEAQGIRPLKLRTPHAIIPNGVFVEEFDPLPKPGLFRTQLNLPADRRYVLFLSRLHAKKGLDVLAHAFARVSARFPDVDLVVAGPADGAEVAFRSLVDTLGLRDRVHLTGPIYGETKLQAIVDADCFCLPSRQEGFSVAIIEAMACARPVVITDQCHFPEVRTAGAGIIVPVDAERVARALEQVLGDRQQAHSMGQKGRELILDNFTWPVIAAKTLNNYRISA